MVSQRTTTEREETVLMWKGLARFRKRLTGREEFAAIASLEDIEIDLFGPFLDTPCENINQLVIFPHTASL